MSPWQIVRQLKALLEAAAWPDGTTDRVFGLVAVTAQGPWPTLAGRGRLPGVVISVGRAQADDHASDVLVQELEVHVVAHVATDVLSEGAIIGGSRTGGQGSSAGRGVLELEEEVLRAVRFLNETNGVRIQTRWTGAAEVRPVEGVGTCVTKAVALDVWTTTNRSYPAPTRLAATAPGGGAVNLSWSVPPSRFDRLEVRLRRAAGSTPPATVTDGTSVALGSALATSVADTPGAGTWSYALFAGYDELLPWRNGGAGTVDRWSSAATKTLVAT